MSPEEDGKRLSNFLETKKSHTRTVLRVEYNGAHVQLQCVS